jgi:hypothetical protein
MARIPVIPAELTRGPFTLAEARQAGLDRWHLDGGSWRRIGPSIYAWAGLAQSPELMLSAACLRLPTTAAFSGQTAAWLHGIDMNPCDPIEVTVPPGSGVSGRSGLLVRRAALPDRDVVGVRGWRATTINRTLTDLCSHLSMTEAVVVVDSALHARIADLAMLKRYSAASSRCVRLAKSRRAIRLAEPASESPMESRLRMLLVLGGLPRPQAQVSLTDRKGRFLGRPDL